MWFKYTGIKLDLLTDYDMLLMFENGIRGGYSGVLGDRYVKANNKYLGITEEKLLKEHLLNEKNYQENPTRNNNFKLKQSFNYCI